MSRCSRAQFRRPEWRSGRAAAKPGPPRYAGGARTQPDDRPTARGTTRPEPWAQAPDVLLSRPSARGPLGAASGVGPPRQQRPMSHVAQEVSDGRAEKTGPAVCREMSAPQRPPDPVAGDNLCPETQLESVQPMGGGARLDGAGGGASKVVHGAALFGQLAHDAPVQPHGCATRIALPR